jgi:hypothetical protein
VKSIGSRFSLASGVLVIRLNKLDGASIANDETFPTPVLSQDGSEELV